MLLLEQFDDGLGEPHRARFDGIACELSALENDLRKYREGVLHEAAVAFFEIGGHEGAMDLVERARELLAVMAAPVRPSDERAQFPLAE